MISTREHASGDLAHDHNRSGMIRQLEPCTCAVHVHGSFDSCSHSIDREVRCSKFKHLSFATPCFSCSWNLNAIVWHSCSTHTHTQTQHTHTHTHSTHTHSTHTHTHKLNTHTHTHTLHTHTLHTHTLHTHSGRTKYQELEEEVLKISGDQNSCFLTRDLHVYPDYHGNRSPLADPELRGMVSGREWACVWRGGIYANELGLYRIPCAWVYAESPVLGKLTMEE